MMAKGRSDKELWEAIERSDDDLLDLNMPESLVDQELAAIGVDPETLATRALEFVARAKEEERLSWQEEARCKRQNFELLVNSNLKVKPDMPRAEVLSRLDELRRTDERVGSAIRMAARKRKPEESSDDELRTLLEEMEALRAVERGGRS